MLVGTMLVGRLGVLVALPGPQQRQPRLDRQRRAAAGGLGNNSNSSSNNNYV